jgi:hypothetical protein
MLSQIGPGRARLRVYLSSIATPCRTPLSFSEAQQVRSANRLRKGAIKSGKFILQQPWRDQDRNVTRNWSCSSSGGYSLAYDSCDSGSILGKSMRDLGNTETRVRARVWSCGGCFGQSGTGAGFLLVLRFPQPILIPPTAPHSSSIARGSCNRPCSRRSTERTQSHPIKINK